MTEENLIEKNWSRIKDLIIKANGNLKAIKVIPVTKTVGIAEITVLKNLGFDCFAENRIDALKEKLNHFVLSNLKWDFIGNIQSRKIPEILTYSHFIHSVGNSEIISKINTCAKNAKKIADVLLQINIAEEPQKSGFSADEIKLNFSNYLKLENIRIKGLMTMAPQTDNVAIIRKTFGNLRKLRDLLKNEAYSDFRELSMGMSNDFEIATQEGATILRIGSSFFKEFKK